MELKTGSVESTLDDKGRVNIPVRFRERYQGELVITYGMERCAEIRTPTAWEDFETEIHEYQKKANMEMRRYYENKYLNNAQPVELDKAGRIAIPPTIRKYANLTRDCIVIRAENRLSVWDRDVFDAYLAEKDAQAWKVMNELSVQGPAREGAN